MVHCSREYVSFNRCISWKFPNPRCTEIQTSCNFKAKPCSRGVAVAFTHFRWHYVFLGPLYFPIIWLCTNNCMHPDIGILILKNLLHSSPSKSTNSKPRSAEAALWRMDSAERRSVQKDCFFLIMDTADLSSLLYSVWHTYCFNS